MRPRIDCRHFLGHRPCGLGKECRGCRHYAPWRERCLIIKLAAKGDVLRTTPLAAALKRDKPDTMVTWLTDADALPLLRHNPHIDRLLPYDAASLVQLGAERFDRLICLDKEPRAAALASSLDSGRKQGFGWDPRGGLVPMDHRAAFLYRLGLSDEIKFRVNRKSYQQLVIEAAGLKHEGLGYHYTVTREEAEWAAGYLSKTIKAGARRPWIGVNTGTGRAYPAKAWPAANQAKLVRELKGRKLGTPVILGGPDEKGVVEKLRRLCPGTPAIAPDLDIRSFAAVISRLDMVVSSDSLAMHLAIALKRRTIALFGPTCSREIDLYGLGEKLELGLECSPCYRASCPDAGCMAGLTATMVLEAIERLT
jgi:heptosyltransferase-2